MKENLGLRSANMLSYDSHSEQGMRNLSHAAVGGTAQYMSARSVGEASVGAVYNTSGSDAILDAYELAKTISSTSVSSEKADSEV